MSEDKRMDKNKQNRLLSFTILGIICILASVIGFMAYNLSSGEWWLRLFIAGALLNIILFLCVSIPLAEGRQSAKEGHLEYKKETRMLLPVPK